MYVAGAGGGAEKASATVSEDVLDVLKGAAGEAGEFVKGDVNVPSSVRAVTREMLKTYARSKGYFIEGKTSNQHRADLSRDLKWLKVNGFIGLTDRYVGPSRGEGKSCAAYAQQVGIAAPEVCTAACAAHSFRSAALLRPPHPLMLDAAPPNKSR